ncbi:MAG: SigB/SigF/SigG family RNA polymerase sigma factor [Blautia sp.]|nr:SigB/SigF/SigG family RNA polymerase sigma factor [Muribaculaceae bacterium]MCM1144792.1 SigB/SigF/SigG family RNA polymerase sigma factor [Lachnoclostridium sp.]MCM1212043.1 SigB/SigF/SigG family RNA polymerase sigma factor [Blautia sp.]
MEETAVLIERSQAGDKEARERLIEENLGLVRHIVKRFLDRGYDAEDLFQIGCIGLMKAIDKFDLSFDVKFSTYAVPMIQGEIKRFLRDDGMVKVSRTLKENGWKIKQAAEKLMHAYGRDATLQELAEETQLSIEDIVLALDANVEVESIYKSVYQSDGNEIYLVDQVVGEVGGVGRSVLGDSPGGNDVCEDTEKEKLLNHMLLEQLLDGLEEKERELIRLRYYQDKTQVEVAKKMGISQVQVSRMEKRILLQLRSCV